MHPIPKLILLLAILLGTISKYAPHLFFRIPHVGFVLWALTGHPLPPFFNPTSMTQPHFHKVVQPGDTIFASLPKSGTIWIHNIIHLLKNGGNDDFVEEDNDGNDAAGLMSHVAKSEFMLYPEQTVEERIQLVQRLRETQANNPQRTVKTLTHFSHLSPANDGIYGLNVDLHPDIQYVISMRHPKEIMRSFYRFFLSFTPEYRKLWGGFPPQIKSKEECLDFILTNPEFIFGAATAWWEVRDRPNVLMVHFSDLKKDLRGQIVRLAKFLNISLTDDVLDVVEQKSKYEYMKRREMERPGFYAEWVGRPNEPKFMPSKEHLGEGRSGDSEEFFTEEMNRKYEEVVGRNLERDHPELLRWMMEGGDYGKI